MQVTTPQDISTNSYTHIHLKAVSVYIPTWKDTVAWARREPDLLAQLKTGYPRFFIPLVVGQLSDRLLEWATSEASRHGIPSHSRSLLAEPGRSAMLFPASHQANMCQTYLERQEQGTTIVLRFDFNRGLHMVEDSSHVCTLDDVYAVVYPQELATEAKAFWQHAGFGISSRRATHWLESAAFLNEHSHLAATDFPASEAQDAKLAIRKRIADLLSTKTNSLAVDDVFLYPTGMSAISHAADTIRYLDPTANKTVAIFGFLYVDTFKVLSKIHGFSCKLYGATPSDLETLEADLAAGLQLSALFTEFPGNPLLGSVDLERLQKLASGYQFLFVVDDTVATSVNVELITCCDVVCTSLTKMFSGSCNVMGGSIALNPQSRLFSYMKELLTKEFVDTYFPLDAIVMESNSANFEQRVMAASQNAERIADMLWNHPSVEKVYYPKGNLCQDMYEKHKSPSKGYGYLLSIRLKTPEAAVAFYDALDVAKGPSLGTNFTLCCAYTLFAHYSELEWAAKFGVVEHLIRISVGIESQQCLDELVRAALNAASGKLNDGEAVAG
ncbi:hypothetical protein F66182_10490 [Fusarium sp. NRRL 66182]|nr:hypothetical protein F66182_10490 [Fusarium sp. NRRL 66182]